MREPLWQPRSDLGVRLLGAGFLAFGAGLLALQARSVLAAAGAGQPITYFSAAIALGEFATLLGVYWLARGLAGYRAVCALREKPSAFRRLGIASVVIVGGTLAVLHAWLRLRGFTD